MGRRLDMEDQDHLSAVLDLAVPRHSALREVFLVDLLVWDVAGLCLHSLMAFLLLEPVYLRR